MSRFSAKNVSVSAASGFIILWGSAFVVAVLGVGVVPPFFLAWARFLGAGLILTMLALHAKASWPRGNALGHTLVVGLFMQAIQFCSFYSAASRGLSGAMVALIQGCNPMLIALLARFTLRESVTRWQWIGYTMGIIGIAVAILSQGASFGSAILYALVGVSGLSIGSIYHKRFTAQLDVRSTTALHFLVSAVVAGLLTLFTEQHYVRNWFVFSWTLAWIVIVNSVLSFLLLNHMLQRQSAHRVGSLFALTPLSAAVLSWICLGQQVGIWVAIGLVLSAIGAFIARRKP